MGRKSKSGSGSVYARGQVIWVAYDHPVKGRQQHALPEIRVDALGKAEAKRQGRIVLDDMLRQLAAGVDVSTRGPVTVHDWFTSRVRTRPEGRKELAAIELHGGPLLRLRLTDLTPHVLATWIRGMTGAPKSIWHRWSNLRTAMRDAKIAGHIPEIPMLPPDTLPLCVDSDPLWRDRAVYTIAEVERLISDERIPLHRRVLYALKALTGARHGEAVGLRWSAIDWTAEPLPKVTIAMQYHDRRTKTRATKIVPIHPVLGAMLLAWRTVETERTGAEPADDAFIIPAIGERRPRRPTPSDSNPKLAADLTTLGLRVRDGHDFRATFITVALDAAAAEGIPEHVVKSMTHANAVVRSAFDAYKRVTYASKCAVIGAIKVRTLFAINYVATTVAANGSESDMFSGSVVKTVLAPTDRHSHSRGSDSKHLRVVTPPAERQEPSGTVTDCSDVVATPDDARARIDAIEAQVKSLLHELDKLRR